MLLPLCMRQSFSQDRLFPVSSRHTKASIQVLNSMFSGQVHDDVLLSREEARPRFPRPERRQPLGLGLEAAAGKNLASFGHLPPALNRCHRGEAGQAYHLGLWMALMAPVHPRRAGRDGTPPWS